MTGPRPGSWQPDPAGRYDYRWQDGQGFVIVQPSEGIKIPTQ